MKTSPAASKVSAYVKKLEPCFARFAGKPLTRDMLADMVRELFAVMPVEGKPTDEMTSATMRSLSPLAMTTLNASMVKRNMQRIVANWNFIQDGTPVPMWDGSKTPTEVTFIGLAKEQANDQRFVFLVKLKTGLCAGIISCALLYRNFLTTFLQHDAGVSKLNCAPEDLAGMNVHAVAQMLPDRVQLTEITCSAADKAHNKELVEARRDVTKCAIAPMPCNVCQKHIKECPLAIWLPDTEEKP